MMKRTLISSTITSAWILLQAAPTGAQQGTFQGQLTMDSYVQEVLARHPRVPTMQAGRDASRTRIPQAGSLPDPVIGAGVMNLPGGSFSFDQIDMTMKTLSISQSFPSPGALKARTALAESQVSAADADIALTEMDLTRQARLVYLDLYFIERALEIVVENQALLEQFIQITESRYRTGGGLQQDILKARLEHSRLTERLITLEASREGLLSDFNILRDRPAEEPVVLAGLPDPVEVQADPADLIEVAITHSPALQKDLADVEMRERALALARTLLRPGWTAGASYAQRDGDRGDLLSANLMIQVPLYSGRKQKRAIEEQNALLEAAGYRSRDTELVIAAEIRRLHSQLDRSRRLMALYSGEILTEAEGVLESALAGYQVGQSDFLTLLSAQTTLFNYQLESIRVITDYHRRLAMLEAVIGAPVDTAGLEEQS